jgi:hypothetical protein
MTGSKFLCACILIFVVIISSQAEARLLMDAASYSMQGPRSDAVVEGDGGFATNPEMASAGQGGESRTMQMTTTDSRPTAPGNSPGIGNKGEITN